MTTTTFGFAARVSALLSAISLVAACGGGSSSKPPEKVDQSPVAIADSALTAPQTPVIVRVLANDTDVDSTELHAQVVSATHGAATVNPDDTVTFTPADGFAGTATFDYRAVDSDGAASAAVTVTVTVRPFVSAVFVEGQGDAQVVKLSAPQGDRVLSPALPAGASIDHLVVSQNGRTAIWVARQSFYDGTWYASDMNTAGAASDIGADPTQTNNVVLSPDGAHLLESHAVQIPPLLSNIVYLHDLMTGAGATLPASNQILTYHFTPDGRDVVYRTNSPTRFTTDIGLQRAPVATPQSPVTIWQTAGLVDVAQDFAVAPDGSTVLLVEGVDTPGGLYAIDAVASGPRHFVGPTTSSTRPSIEGITYAPQGGHAAFATRNVTFPAPQVADAVYLSDLTAPYANRAVGPALAVGTQVGVPVFNQDGTRLIFPVVSATESAVYEADVSSPATTVRVTPSYPRTVSILQVAYAFDGSIVYLADAGQAGRFDLLVARNGVATTLDDPAAGSVYTLSTQSFQGGFFLASDGKAVLYAQPSAAGGALDLKAIDVRTPGFPLTVGHDVAGVQFDHLGFAAR